MMFHYTSTHKNVFNILIVSNTNMLLNKKNKCIWSNIETFQYGLKRLANKI
jgi:hypothetical protein